MMLSEARVLCIGAGGLGSPALLALAASGVGTLGIVDADDVDLSNLQRQILHHTPDVGRRKVESARATLAARFPAVRVETHDARFDVHNAEDLCLRYDLLLDGSDNFRTKFLANDAALRTRRPLVHGGILRWFGQLMTIRPFESACYRCLFEAPPDAGEVPSCAEAGVVGAIAGVIGFAMAQDAIRVLTGVGRTYADRLLTFDALRARFREVPLRRNPRCGGCGPDAVRGPLRDEDYPTATCANPTP